MHYHHQNLTDGKFPLWRYGRAWWWRLAWCWTVFHRPRLGFSVSRSREDGIGFSVRLLLFSLYVHLRAFRPRRDRSRHFDVYWHDGIVWLTLWADPDGDRYYQRPKSMSRWRYFWHRFLGQHTLDVVDWLIGKAKCTHTKGAPIDVFVPLPEGSYRATATPETFEWRRRWYWPLRRRDSVYINIPGGIPFAGKGENSWDCGDDGLFGCGGDTVEGAIAHAVEASLRYRRRYGHDSQGTGRKPAVVLNAESKGP